MRTGSLGVVLVLVMGAVPALGPGKQQKASGEHVQVVANEAERRVDILVDGKPFTSYIWPATLKKPVLYPLRTAKGTAVTRGYPLEPRPGERVDHPHQAGLWFSYGNVNGVDFWNNSDAIPAADAPKMGVIRHARIVSAKNGAQAGELEVETEWLNFARKAMLRERTRFVFSGGETWRSIVRVTTLTAAGETLRFHDDKEGLLGMRVVRALEMPSNEPLVFTDGSGRATSVAKLDNTGVNGMYRTSEGATGDAAWGTRARWCSLSGRIGDEAVTITIFDNPANPGFPAYWHARGYGLFAVNPLGARIFSNGRDEREFVLAPKQSATFRYEVLIREGIANPESTESAYEKFTSAYR